MPPNNHAGAADGPISVALIAGSGGPAIDVIDTRDPYEILDDLMCVVEELCPEWPDRPGFSTSGTWLL